MSGKKQIYKAWEQVDMCDEKGNRVIHFYLRSTSASPVLAAVGTEKRGHHYVYIVSKEFVETFGSSPAINARTKWTAREHVTDWLVSLVRNGNLSPTKPGTYSCHNTWGVIDWANYISGVLYGYLCRLMLGLEEIRWFHDDIEYLHRIQHFGRETFFKFKHIFLDCVSGKMHVQF